MHKGYMLFKMRTPQEKGQNPKKIFASKAFMIVFSIVANFLGGSKIIEETYNPYKSDNAMTIVYMLLWVLFISFVLVWVFDVAKKAKNEELFLYENCLKGVLEVEKSGILSFFSANKLERVTIYYNDIDRVAISNNTVVIYTRTRVYKIFGFNRQYEIVDIIQQQKEKLENGPIEVEKGIEENENKQKILSVCDVPETSGIYILNRAEYGFKYAYIGKAKNILRRLAQHLSGCQQIDLSVKKHGLYSADNPSGWNIKWISMPEEMLDKSQQETIEEYANNGYQLLNNISQIYSK